MKYFLPLSVNFTGLKLSKCDINLNNSSRHWHHLHVGFVEDVVLSFAQRVNWKPLTVTSFTLTQNNSNRKKPLKVRLNINIVVERNDGILFQTILYHVGRCDFCSKCIREGSVQRIHDIEQACLVLRMRPSFESEISFFF